MLAGQRRRRSPFEVTILFVPVSVVLGQVAACWAEDCDQTTLRLGPICKRDSIVEHGHRRKQAHDEHHDWIEIRRGFCSSEPQRAPGECASSPDCRARNGVVAQYAERDGQAVLRDVLRQRPRALLGDSFHPGGVQLTRRIGNLRSIAVAGMGWLATVVVPRIFMAARSITTSSMSYPALALLSSTGPSMAAVQLLGNTTKWRGAVVSGTWAKLANGIWTTPLLSSTVIAPHAGTVISRRCTAIRGPRGVRHEVVARVDRRDGRVARGERASAVQASMRVGARQPLTEISCKKRPLRETRMMGRGIPVLALPCGASSTA